jgi:photosynthetic reaction center H subunit
MFHNAFFAGDFDFTSLIFGTFVLFFVGLIVYLRREDRREGYPLEDEVSGRLEARGGLFFAATPKTFILAHGTHSVPHANRDSHDIAAVRTSRANGSPLEPKGEPMLAGVGPGAFAQRARRPELTFHGDAKIVPLRVASEFSIAKGDADPRGMTVVGADGVAAGVVTDVWVDRSESIIRYMEAELTGAVGKRVLFPMTMADVQRGSKTVCVDAVLGSQFAQAPVLENPNQITLYEEERVVAYFGAGYLYATPQRAEPIL